jgi:endonuclease/exonuclease/phosphatase family metal-dependent hydrolase
VISNKKSVQKLYAIISILFCIHHISACNEKAILEGIPKTPMDNIQVSRYGSEKSFDIATWNIEHFPRSQSYTIPNLSRIIRNIDIDLIAVQEIDKSSSFQILIDSLDGYMGYVSPLPDYGQRLGIIYKSDIVSLSEPYQIFTNDNWAFPRPPLVTFVTVKDKNLSVFDFVLIILHLKAFDDEESRTRRRTACEKLKFYLDTYILTGIEKDVIVLGDFNDELDDPQPENIFGIFTNDSTNYRFLTLPLANHPTYIGQFESSIDHLLITMKIEDDHTSGLTRILKLDKEFSDYLNTISDHRPVLTQFFVF